MPRSQSKPKAHVRVLQAALLLMLLSTLSGCVYLRLLKFKQQLKDFDEYVAVERGDGLAFKMLDPVLRDDDFVFITESQPSRIRSLSLQPLVEDWEWTFEKKLEAEDDAPFEITFRTRFEEGMLTRIDFDPQLLEAIPEDFIVQLFKSLGEARINKLRRSATATMTRDSLTEVPLPSLAEISTLMGQPTDKKRAENRRHWRYVFNFYNPKNKDLSGQFNIVFKAESDDTEKEISGFEVTGKAR